MHGTFESFEATRTETRTRPAAAIFPQAFPKTERTKALIDLMQPTTLRRVEAREHVFCEGDPRTHVFEVETGAIVVYKVLPDGRRQVMSFAYPGDLIGLGASSEHTLNAQAASPAKLRCLAAHSLEEAAGRDPALAVKLYRAVSRELTETQSLLVSIGQQTALERVATFLFSLDQRAKARGENVLHLPMRRSDIADFLGLTIETVSRTFTKLRTMGVIKVTHGTEVRIVDGCELEALTGQ